MKTEAPAKAGILNRPVQMPDRRTARWLLLAAMVAACLGALWFWMTHPPRPWLVRWRVERYLKKESHTGNFKVDFPFPSKAEMSKAAAKSAEDSNQSKGVQTGKGFETLRDEYFTLKTAAVQLEGELARAEAELKQTTAKLDALTQELADAATTNAANVATLQSNQTVLRERVAELRPKTARAELLAKEQEIAPIASDLWEFQRAWKADAESPTSPNASQFAQARAKFSTDLRQKLREATSYTEMYRLIGQEIWVAGRLLDSANPAHRRAGVSLALDASQQALNDAQNGWVAARICEGYIWPHLDLADDKNRRSTFNPQTLLTECADIFRRNNEYNNVVRTYETALAKAGSPAQADSARMQLSLAWEQAGDNKRAAKYLRQIQNTNDFRGAMRRLQRLEPQAAK